MPNENRAPERMEDELEATIDRTSPEKAADPATLPMSEKPAGAPGGIGGRATDKEREDRVVHESDESFPASDPPARG